MRETGASNGRMRAAGGGGHDVAWARWLVRSRSPRAYAVASIVLLVALSIRGIIDLVFPGVPPFVTLFPAVVLAGLFCGAAAGSAVAILGAVAACFFWLPPRWAFGPMEAGEVVSLAMFLLSSSLILWTTSRLRDALVAADSARIMLDTALGLGNVGTWEVDLHTLRVRASGSTHALHGIPDDGRERPAEEWQAAVHADDRDALRQALSNTEATGAPFAAEYRVPRPDGSVRRILSRGGVVSIGGRRRLVGTLIDITDRALVEERLRSQEAGLREALAERDMLVREADHRIKNSLQLVLSLLRLQRGQVVEPEAAEALGSAVARVEAIAQSHKALQQSKDLRTVDFSDTLRDLCASLGLLNPEVEMRCGSEGGLELDAERAIPLALIVSELVTNALRHAYPGGSGQIIVDAVATGNTLIVNVTDHGVGMAVNAGESGLGSKVIRSLSRQIGADVTLRSKLGEGAVVTVKMPHHATATAN